MSNKCSDLRACIIPTQWRLAWFHQRRFSSYHSAAVIQLETKMILLYDLQGQLENIPNWDILTRDFASPFVIHQIPIAALGLLSLLLSFKLCKSINEDPAGGLKCSRYLVHLYCFHVSASDGRIRSELFLWPLRYFSEHNYVYNNMILITPWC